MRPAAVMSARLPRLRGRVWLLGLLAWIAPAIVLANTIGLLLSGQGGGYAEALEAVSAEVRKLPGSRVVSGLTPNAGSPGGAGTTAAAGALPDDFAGVQLVIAVGTRAAQHLLRVPELRVPVLCLLVPRSSYETLVSGLRAADARRVSAVFLDQPLARQIELIRQALPGLNRVGTVTGPDSARELDRLQQAIEARGIKLVSERVARDSELFPALSRVMSDSDVFLALPDSRVINSDTAQNLLLTSYRLRSPVIGYSAAYVRAGAFAAVFSTPQQMGLQAGEIARAYLRSPVLPAPQYPRNFSVAVNRQVSRSLGLEPDEDTVLRDRIQRSERE